MTRAAAALGGLLAATLAAAAPARAQAAAQGCPPGDAGACYRHALSVAEKALAAGSADDAALGEALELFERACARGVGDACYFAGRILTVHSGQTASRSLADEEAARAADLFQAGCHTRPPSAAACNALGFASAYVRGKAAPPDSVLHHLLDGCGYGNPTACGRAAARLHDWTGRATRLTTRPAEMERAACAGGSPIGCMRVAERGRTFRAASAPARPPAQAPRADSVVRAACRDGLPTACTALGAAFSAPGSHLPRQRDSALHYYALACRGPAQDSAWVGDGRGCAQGGHLLLRRARTSADTTQAIRWLDEGCTLLDSDACADLAHHGFRSGRVAGHLALFRAVTACNEGSGYGCRVAAELYQDPALYEPERVEQYLERGCGLGDGAACTGLAEAKLDREDGGDVFKLLRRACTLRDGRGCATYGAVAARLAGRPEAGVRFLALGCDYGDAGACAGLAQLARERGDEVGHGEYRGRACRLDAEYCKQKG